MMSFTYSRTAIMKAAHFMARWRVATVGGSYREWFAKALVAEWEKAKAARLRLEQNTGLPIRSCFADAPAWPVRCRCSSTGPPPVIVARSLATHLSGSQ